MSQMKLESVAACRQGSVVTDGNGYKVELDVGVGFARRKFFGRTLVGTLGRTFGKISV